MKNPLNLLPPFLVAATVLGPGMSSGGNLMNPYPPASCGSLGCNSLIETKLYQVSHPVVFQAYARSGECFQVRALDLNNDLELIVIHLMAPCMILTDMLTGTRRFLSTRLQPVPMRFMWVTGRVLVLAAAWRLGSGGITPAIPLIARFSTQ